MPYSILTADLDKDRESIISLWARNLQEHGVPSGRYDWIYHNNPYGDPTCFLLRHDDSDSVVGSYTLFPRSLILDGRKVRAYICGDLVVDTAHRALGPALSLVKKALSYCREEEGSVLFGFPNNLSEPVLFMGGFKKLSEFTQMAKIVSTYPYILRYLNVPLVARILSCPCDFFLSLRYAADNSEYRYEIVKEFDERFGQFWDGIAVTFSVKGEMTSEYLNWRFKDSPYGEHQVFTLLSKAENRLSGYIVFRIDEKRTAIADIGYSGDEVDLKVLVSMFYSYLKSQGLWSVEFGFSGSASFVEQLAATGFSLRSKALKAILFAPAEKKAIIKEINNGFWYLTSADNDI